MIFINPHWQGSGFTDELKFGAEPLNLYFNNFYKATIPLSTKKLTAINNNEYAYLGFMYVKPAFRGQGIKQKLLQRLIDWAKNQNDRSTIRSL